jgi:hypothetical protein
MSGTGLSAKPQGVPLRLADQPDAQIDTWASELMRDVVIRRGIVKVVNDFRTATKSQRGLNSNACSLLAVVRPGRSGGDAAGHLVVPTISLWALVPDFVARPRQPWPPDRVPRLVLQRARLRLTRPHGRNVVLHGRSSA